MRKLLYILLFLPVGLNAQVYNLNGGGLPDVLTLDTLTVTVLNYVPPHGWFAFHDSSVTLDMTEDEYSMVTNPTRTLFSTVDAVGITFGGDSMTVITAGDYMMNISLSFSGSAADSYEITFFKNNVVFDQSMNRSTSQTDIGNVSLPVYLESLIAGDDITFKIQNTASNDDATIISCSWVVWLLHT